GAPVARRSMRHGCRARRSRVPRGDRGGDRTGAARARAARRGRPRARRPLHLARLRRGSSEGVGRLRVALDVSPLRQTRAGTARYLNGLLGAGLPGVELHPVAFGGSARLTAAVRDTVWYLGVLPYVARGADVLHCPTYRAPLRCRTPVVVTVHDLAVFRFPETFRPWTRTYSRALVPRVVRAAARVIA